jgi:hypothetical protein
MKNDVISNQMRRDNAGYLGETGLRPGRAHNAGNKEAVFPKELENG